jgi:hypothetical protein
MGNLAIIHTKMDRILLKYNNMPDKDEEFLKELEELHNLIEKELRGGGGDE